MASAHIFTVPNSVDVALVGGAFKTILQLRTPASRRAWVKEAAIGFKSVTTTDGPVLVQLVRQSTGGTMTGVTPVACVDGHPAALCTAGEDASAEPTFVAVVMEWEITPIAGQLVYQIPLGDEIEMAVSSFLGLRANAPQNQNARGYLKFNE